MLGATNDAKSIPNPSILDYVAVALSAGCALLLVPFALRRQRPQCPKGRRDGSRRFRCVHMDVHSAEHRWA